MDGPICWIFTKFHQIGWFSAQNLSIRLLLGHRRQVNSAISLHGKNFCGFIYAPAIFLAKLDFYEKTWYSYFLVEQHLGCSFVLLYMYALLYNFILQGVPFVLYYFFSFDKNVYKPSKKICFLKTKICLVFSIRAFFLNHICC